MKLAGQLELPAVRSGAGGDGVAAGREETRAEPRILARLTPRQREITLRSALRAIAAIEAAAASRRQS